jgi:hypothetical protein
VKRQDSDPAAAEKEQLRQLTRELHEAAKDGYAAAKALRAAFKEAGDDIEATLERLVDQGMAELNDHITRSHQQLNQNIGNLEQQTRDHYARLMGHQDAQELASTIVREVYDLLVPEMNEVLRTLPGQLADVRIQPVNRRPEKGLINVIDEATYLAKLRDGTISELGMIIDGR